MSCFFIFLNKVLCFKKLYFVLCPRVHFYLTGVPGKFLFSHKGSNDIKSSNGSDVIHVLPVPRRCLDCKNLICNYYFPSQIMDNGMCRNLSLMQNLLVTWSSSLGRISAVVPPCNEIVTSYWRRYWAMLLECSLKLAGVVGCWGGWEVNHRCEERLGVGSCSKMWYGRGVVQGKEMKIELAYLERNRFTKPWEYCDE